MMTKLYIIGKILTFPGAYIKGFWGQLTCRTLGLPVEVPGHLRIDEACGHVEHAFAKKGFASYLMATGPGFMNFITGVPLFIAGFLNLRYMGITPYDSVPLFILYVLMLYVGVSLLCNVFPLTEDILNFWYIAYEEKNMNIVGRIIFAIPAIITRAGAFLEKYSITVILWIAWLVVMFII